MHVHVGVWAYEFRSPTLRGTLFDPLGALIRLPESHFQVVATKRKGMRVSFGTFGTTWNEVCKAKNFWFEGTDLLKGYSGRYAKQSGSEGAYCS